jgi:hypothetical protein
MTVVGKAISKWRPVIEHVFFIFRSTIDGVLESVVFSPTVQNGTFNSREVGSVWHSWVGSVI